MTSPSRDQLLGYLLKALGPDEQQQVEADLDHDPQLAAEMQRLERSLEQFGLGGTPEYIDPPPGLAERTCRYVAARAPEAFVTPAGLVALNHTALNHTERERRFTWSDFVTMAAVIVVAASLFFPALSFSRFQYQITACQNQLRELGLSLHRYSDLQPDRSFPGPEIEGNRAAAGIVAPTLVSHHLASPRMFLCASSPRLRDMADFRVPTLEEIDMATGQELKVLSQMMGGDYGYNLGYVSEGKLQRPSNARRPNYVLVGDAPSNSQPKRASSNHRGRGQNILYEDGRTHFLAQLKGPTIIDDPYHNRDGWVSAGLDRDDAVLGASADPPLPVTLISEP